MEKEIKRCPYCGGENVRRSGEGGTNEPCEYYCSDCDIYFSGADVRREEIRHEMSALLMGHTEVNPLYVGITLVGGSPFGLSTNDMLVVSVVFEDSDIIWFGIEGYSKYVEFDDMALVDLENILEEIK